MLNLINSSKINTNSKVEDVNYYWDKILSRKQGFTDLPKQAQITFKLKEFVDNSVIKYEHIVILGIGGSMLGPKCILDCLHKSNSSLKVHYLDNIDPSKIAHVESLLNYEKTIFLVQTKSGQTPETVAQYAYFRAKIDNFGLNASDHFVFVTDPSKGYLRTVADSENIPSFEIPENVGGRFSVLTPVGLLVSVMVGLDVENLLLGAQVVLENKLNQAFELAVIQHQLLREGQGINVIMPYSSRLKTFAEWSVQLISESLGKEFDLDGNLVNTGITPLPAVGATDQHSQLQLFTEGPNDKLIIFIKPKDYGVKLQIPDIQEQSLSYLNNHSFDQLLDAEFDGVQQALTERSRPNVTIEIDQVNEYSLGELFMFFELATAFVGEMLNIDTFNQPGVERSKILTKENLLN
ncbi:MAG: glucose-6-phosphate isomerase [Patescibacteria group bacterium]